MTAIRTYIGLAADEVNGTFDHKRTTRDPQHLAFLLQIGSAR